MRCRFGRQVDDMLLMVNVDDVSGETISHVIEGLMALGAGSVHVTQGITKKGRPEFLFFVDSSEKRVEALGSFMVSELGTLGIRVIETRHIRFDYRLMEVLLINSENEHPLEVTVMVKEIQNNEGRIVSVKADYEDLKMAVTQFQQVGLDISFVALKGLAEQTVLERADLSLGRIQAKYSGEK